MSDIPLQVLKWYCCYLVATRQTELVEVPEMKKVLASLLMVLLVSTASVFAAGAPKKGYVIALSNSYYGNSWRKQMVDCFTKSATQAKEQGKISDFIIVNGDGTQNTQISQLNSLILSDVDAICINAASPTALNGVIEKAIRKGIMNRPGIAGDRIP
jgi:ribose transport system substrate-binding protein